MSLYIFSECSYGVDSVELGNIFICNRCDCSHGVAYIEMKILFESVYILGTQQGVRLRVVGVCDSKSLVVAPDVFTEELDDPLLLEVCKAKSSGASLQTVSNFGKAVNFFACQWDS